MYNDLRLKFKFLVIQSRFPQYIQNFLLPFNFFCKMAQVLFYFFVIHQNKINKIWNLSSAFTSKDTKFIVTMLSLSTIKKLWEWRIYNLQFSTVIVLAVSSIQSAIISFFIRGVLCTSWIMDYGQECINHKQKNHQIYCQIVGVQICKLEF